MDRTDYSERGPRVPESADLPLERAHPLRDAGLAFTQLSVAPLAVRWPDAGRPDVASYYPFVGLALGATGAGLVWAMRTVGWSGSAVAMVAAVVVALWALFTRGLHWDGLADVFDAWHGANPDARREIMKDSHVGAFGATAIALLAIVEVAALASILSGRHEAVLIAVPAIARLAATFSAWIGKPASRSGLGAAVCRPPGIVGIFSASVGTALALVVLQVALGRGGLYLGVGGVATALVVPDLIARRFGGVTGDTMGASIMLTETLVFLATALVWGV